MLCTGTDILQDFNSQSLCPLYTSCTVHGWEIDSTSYMHVLWEKKRNTNRTMLKIEDFVTVASCPVNICLDGPVVAQNFIRMVEMTNLLQQPPAVHRGQV